MHAPDFTPPALVPELHTERLLLRAFRQNPKKRFLRRAVDPREWLKTMRSRRKFGRNSPCPCGSGKKYKDCHLGLEAAA